MNLLNSLFQLSFLCKQEFFYLGNKMCVVMLVDKSFISGVFFGQENSAMIAFCYDSR